MTASQKNTYYDGNKLLSMLDLNGRKPRLLFCCGNRTAGKTFYFKRYMLRRFKKHREKFIIFVRYLDDIANCAAGFFADIGPISFPRHEFTQRPLLHGKAAELLFDGIPCGYVIALNDPERIKRNSALFADAVRGFFDEFQAETGRYVPGEISKFNSIITSVARGGATGKHVRYFPVFLASNNVTLFNPYFTYFGIAKKLTNRTRFLRGDGWVVEQTFNTSAAAALRDQYGNISAKELDYMAGNQYLLDTNQFVSKMAGMRAPIANIYLEGRKYGIWQILDTGNVYIDNTVCVDSDVTFALSDSDHAEDTVLLPRANTVLVQLRNMYSRGMVYFRDGACRSAFIAAMCIV